MKVKFGVYIESLGDGSAYPKFFNTEEEAEEYAEEHDNGERLDDDTMSITLEFGSNGKLLNPHRYE